MPVGAGKRHGAEAMMRDGWWAIGRAYAVRAQPGDWLHCADGRLVVLGTYSGARRADNAPVETRFAHVWAADRDRLTALEQITGTARWDRTPRP